MQEVADSLAGRAAVLPFLGLSALEWTNAKDISSNYSRKEFIWKGAYPGIWANPGHNPSRDRWYQGYVATYLERDVRNILNIGSLRNFERFIRACAARTAQTLNISELGRDVGISTSTARNWLSALQASNQIFLLEPYYRSLGKRLVKSPKLYFTDTGLAAYLSGFESPQALFASGSAGAYWENHITIQWLKWRDWHRPAAGIWYWRDQAGNEVDLLLELNQKLYPIEIKFKERAEKKDLRGIQKLIKFYGPEAAAHSFLACLTPTPYDLQPGISAVDGWTPWNLS